MSDENNHKSETIHAALAPKQNIYIIFSNDFSVKINGPALVVVK